MPRPSDPRAQSSGAGSSIVGLASLSRAVQHWFVRAAVGPTGGFAYGDPHGNGVAYGYHAHRGSDLRRRRPRRLHAILRRCRSREGGGERHGRDVPYAGESVRAPAQGRRRVARSAAARRGPGAERSRDHLGRRRRGRSRHRGAGACARPRSPARRRRQPAHARRGRLSNRLQARGAHSGGGRTAPRPTS